jgi:hypothetical protein
MIIKWIRTTGRFASKVLPSPTASDETPSPHRIVPSFRDSAKMLPLYQH